MFNFILTTAKLCPRSAVFYWNILATNWLLRNFIFEFYLIGTFLSPYYFTFSIPDAKIKEIPTLEGG